MHAKSKEEAIEIAKGDEIMEKTIEYVEDYINDPEVISLFHNDSWKIESAEERGEEKGIIKTAKNMLLKKYSPKEISEITNLPISEINKLKVN